MDKEEEKILLEDINERLMEQAKRLLKYISQEMKGKKMEIYYDDSLEESYVGNFLQGNEVLINIDYECNEVTEMKESFNLTLYNLFNNSYEITMAIEDDSPLFALIPPAMINGLRNSLSGQTSVQITL